MRQITLYVGTEFDKRHEVIASGTRKANLLVVKSRLAQEFGGYSIDEVSGGYRHDDGSLAEEKAARIEVTIPEDKLSAFREIARWIRDLFNQESVLVNTQVVESAFI